MSDFGINVTIKLLDGNNELVTDHYHNITEIHYNYSNFGRVPSHRIAFESDIHYNGISHPINQVIEFETEPAQEIHKDF